jgi:hypothetical protein
MGYANLHHHARPLRSDEEAQLCAYNAALDELGLRFRWDAATLRAFDVSRNEKEAIANYLKTHQSYLLKAYDVDFLSQLILDKKNQRLQVGCELALAHYA